MTKEEFDNLKIGDFVLITFSDSCGVFDIINMRVLIKEKEKDSVVVSTIQNNNGFEISRFHFKYLSKAASCLSPLIIWLSQPSPRS